MELLFLLGFHSLRDEMNLMVEVEPIEHAAPPQKDGTKSWFDKGRSSGTTILVYDGIRQTFGVTYVQHPCFF